MATSKQIPIILVVISLFCALSGGQHNRRVPNNRNRNGGKQPILKDTFYEDNSFVVRIKTTYNQSTSLYCNGVVMEEQLIMSDVSCIKYDGKANIDAKYVQVIAGEPTDEKFYDVDVIYINKADPRDPGTELAVLKLSRPLQADTQCRNVIKPERNHSIVSNTAVRVIGYTHNFELKENRSRVANRQEGSKFICTNAADLNDTPGSQLLRGAPLLHMVDCRQYQIVGIWSRTDVLIEPSSKKHQDCYVMVSAQMKWFDTVKSLALLAAKKDDADKPQSSVVTVSVDDEPVVEPKSDHKVTEGVKQ